MDHIKKHKEAFDKIIQKYGLDEESKASEIADFLTGRDKISAREFAELFAMDEHDAVIFLSWIHKGIRFKEENIDKNAPGKI